MIFSQRAPPGTLPLLDGASAATIRDRLFKHTVVYTHVCLTHGCLTHGCLYTTDVERPVV